MATALITGGTSGIGAEFARQLAAQGFDLVLVARDTARLEKMAAELPVAVEVLTADLSDRDQVAKVAARIEDAERPIEVVVNNAGFSVHTLLTDPDLTKHDRALEVMLRTVLVLSGAAGRAMAARGHGRIINVASTAGLRLAGLVLGRQGRRDHVLRIARGRAAQHRRARHRALPRIHPHRVPRARQPQHQLDPRSALGAGRGNGPRGAARFRARQGRLHTHCSVQGADVVRPACAEELAALGVRRTRIQDGAFLPMHRPHTESKT